MTRLLIVLDRWSLVRDRFTDDERAKLNAAIVGHTVCPEGVTVDANLVPASLADKVRDALGGLRR